MGSNASRTNRMFHMLRRSGIAGESNHFRTHHSETHPNATFHSTGQLISNLQESNFLSARNLFDASRHQNHHMNDHFACDVIISMSLQVGLFIGLRCYGGIIVSYFMNHIDHSRCSQFRVSSLLHFCLPHRLQQTGDLFMVELSVAGRRASVSKVPQISALKVVHHKE